MAEYIPPKDNIPFDFTPGGYEAPDFGDISVNFTTEQIQQQMASLGAAIKGIGHYQEETYTFLKYCETYIVGYSQHGVQIIKGKCHYGGIRDLGANIGGHYPGDLPAWVRGVVYRDLSAEILGLQSTQEIDLPAWIGTHLPEDLGGIISAHLPVDLSAYIRGFDYRDLAASIYGLWSRNLPAEIGGHLPEDLGGYIKPWPQRDLPGHIYGWQAADLGGTIRATYYRDLSAVIDMHRPKHIRAMIKGWVREATYDLGAFIHPSDIRDLGAFIRATSMEQLPASIYGIPPRDLPAFIHGWDTSDLGGIITVVQYPWNLPASINITGDLSDLPANIFGRKFDPLPTDLSAFILPTRGVTDLSAVLSVAQARDLSAFIDPGRDAGNLSAEIYPKRIRLTGVISMITMEHRDMSATISVPCFYSDLRELAAFIRPVYQSDLSATIYPKGYVFGQSNLGASFGYALDSVVQDKLKLNLSIIAGGPRTEDKIAINLSIFHGGLSLGAYIFAERQPRDLGAYINAINLEPYDFDTWKGSERVVQLSYGHIIEDYQDVYISFKTIVEHYFYSSGSDVVAKVDNSTHFVTKVASYYSPDTQRRLDKTLHKIKYLYDMRNFATTDESMRYAIWYVTTTPTADLTASINSIAPDGNYDLSARIGVNKYYSVNDNLTSYINGTPTHSYDVVIGITDDGVEYLEF